MTRKHENEKILFFKKKKISLNVQFKTSVKEQKKISDYNLDSFDPDKVQYFLT